MYHQNEKTMATTQVVFKEKLHHEFLINPKVKEFKSFTPQEQVIGLELIHLIELAAEEFNTYGEDYSHAAGEYGLDIEVSFQVDEHGIPEIAEINSEKVSVDVDGIEFHLNNDLVQFCEMNFSNYKLIKELK